MNSSGFTTPQGVKVDLADTGKELGIMLGWVAAKQVPEDAQITLEGCD
jgi:hypothetical protein